MSPQNSCSLNYLLQGIYQKYVKKNRTWCGWDSTHLRFYNSRILKNMLRFSGLWCSSIRSVYLLPYKAKAPVTLLRDLIKLEALSVFDLPLGKMFPFNLCGWNIIVKADKK